MTEKVDGRRARGDITRRLTAEVAARMATVDGLDSISMSQLAHATGYSASGILTVFGNREAIQLAAVRHARTIFIAEVVTPAWGKDPGPKRLTSLVTNWFNYVERGVFPGGCFLVATSVEYGARPGPVAEAVRDLKRQWISLLETELAMGHRPSKKRTNTVQMTAFQLDAYMTAANIRHRIADDPEALKLGKTACRQLLRVAA